MKIRLLSDLHLEGYRFDYEYAGEDVVVLAGDIHSQGRHRYFLNTINPNVPIIMVAGNHEYYGSDFDDTNEYLQQLENTFPNFHYLQNESLHINGVDFFGGTMFTDMKLYNDVNSAKMYASQGIADFTWISKGSKRWSTNDHTAEHEVFSNKLQSFLKEKHSKRVVVSHFVPSMVCADPQFDGSMLNPYFISEMDKYMGWDGLWLFGHTHSSMDKMVGNTRLVCNPRGYGTENSHGFNDKLILEI
jgi:predicted phosphodiesterase